MSPKVSHVDHYAVQAEYQDDKKDDDDVINWRKVLSVKEYKGTKDFQQMLDSLNDKEYEYAATLLG